MSTSEFRDADSASSDCEDADNAGLLGKGCDHDPSKSTGPRQKKTRGADSSRSRYMILAAVFVTLFLLLLSNLVTWHIASRAVRRRVRSVAEPPQVWSTIKQLDLKTQLVQFDSTFFNSKGEFRQPPSPKTDSLWANAGADFGVLLVPSEEGEAAGISPDHIRLVGGEDQHFLEGIPVQVEVFHQLHCLNLLRKTVFYNYDYYRKLGEGPFRHPDKDLAVHVDHCIDNLRQRIMCTSDVGLVPFHWATKEGGTDPEFSRIHTCRDFGSLREWTVENMVRVPPNVTLKPQPGDYIGDGFH